VVEEPRRKAQTTDFYDEDDDESSESSSNDSSAIVLTDVTYRLQFRFFEEGKEHESIIDDEDHHDFLFVNGVKWSLCETQHNLPNLESIKPKIRWRRDDLGLLDEPKPLNFFFLFFSTSYMDTMTKLTNDTRIELRLGSEISRNDLLNWIGVRLGMCLERSRGSCKDYWDNSASFFVRPSCYEGRTGMTHHRFNVIDRGLHTCLR
jgi:hypothetical protein